VHVFAEVFWAPKEGNRDTEYEDAFWPPGPLDSKGASFRFAVSDGATETSYSKIWAKQLVRAYSKGLFDNDRIRKSVSELQARWSEIVRRRPLPWYAEESVRRGAFASILGITLSDDPSRSVGGTWQAVALGDSCLFHLRGEELLASFPIDSSDDFCNRPQLLSSSEVNNAAVYQNIRAVQGVWEEGDSFYLMTDALACWFMSEDERGKRPWESVRDLDSRGPIKPFGDWLSDLRKRKAIRNDDVTLLRVDLL
jgi:hypothetical protein